ncbi:hypothetical protein BKP45_08090 [Anaerobacillus alkalidiazotrophicus]|uniref:Dynamin N-terminal domain-containing protein n=1 Tax=Anaerobacillus alkalidiazotrophicus TaxID=472963 RepID=A0A1S2M8B5_9BACI|nr:dynamin family protein [Anaerobacillus alkalidiazotrophicus]OIJ20750.1 hypothetical protein BKP45_08090 [Anaerobacillus alkalidiazotrophicus]
MELTVTFCDNKITISGENGVVVLPPYFYFFQQRVLIGKQVERSLDLFPQYIFHIFTETNDKRVLAFFNELNHYIVKKDGVHTFCIELPVSLTHFQPLIKGELPHVEVIVNQNNHTRKNYEIEAEMEKHVYKALATVMTNQIIGTHRLSGRLYEKIYQIVRLRANAYLEELLKRGNAKLNFKLVDEQLALQVIDMEVNIQQPVINKIVSRYQKTAKSEKQLVQSQYEMYDGNFKVTFISPFSFGKSTLINGLLGEKLLSMDIRAETAIITKVTCADENVLLVKYQNQRVEQYHYECPIELREKLKELTGVRSVELPTEVQIFYKMSHLPGVTIIDAPGLNSRHADHNEIALQALEMCDLVVFLINPAHIGEANFSEQIKDFLTVVKQKKLKYAFALSKMDIYNDDLEVIKDEMEIVLKDLDPSYSPKQLFFISGYFGLYGKLLRDDKVELNEVQKNRSIFVIENDEILSGREIESYHSQFLLDFSQLERLENFIQERGEFNASNELHMDCRKQEAVGVASGT